MSAIIFSIHWLQNGKAQINAPFTGAWLPDVVLSMMLALVMLSRKLRLTEGGI
jgi:hypothetical protein